MTAKRISRAACALEEHEARRKRPLPSERVLQAVAIMFSACGVADRLRVLVELMDRTMSVVELSAAVGKEARLISQQLRVLRISRLVRRVRVGRFMKYAIIDRHVHEIVESMLVHASRRHR